GVKAGAGSVRDVLRVRLQDLLGPAINRLGRGAEPSVLLFPLRHRQDARGGLGPVGDGAAIGEEVVGDNFRVNCRAHAPSPSRLFSSESRKTSSTGTSPVTRAFS